MPHIQKLYDKIKGRTDIQLVTFNVDDNVGLVGPFLKENNYTFPVVPAEFLIHSLVPSLGIPMNWIVDTSGVVRQEKVGFGAEEKWADETLGLIEKARTGA